MCGGSEESIGDVMKGGRRRVGVSRQTRVRAGGQGGRLSLVGTAYSVGVTLSAVTKAAVTKAAVTK